MTNGQQRHDTLDGAAAIAWDFFEHLNRRDLAGAFALLDDDATFWTNAYRQAMPKDVTVRMLSKVLEYVPARFDLLRSMSHGNVVALEATSSGVTRDDTQYDMVYAFWIEIREGRIIEIREYADTFYGLNIIPPSVMSD